MSDCLPVLLAPALKVFWVNGTERLQLFTYSPVTHVYTETRAGIASGRAALRAVDFLCAIESVPAAKVVSVGGEGYFEAGEWVAVGGIATGLSPRLEFYAGARRLAALSKSGRLMVTKIANGTPVEGGNAFHFFDGDSTLVAKLDGGGLTARNFVQPLDAL